MGCLKLAYRSEEPTLKVVQSVFLNNKKTDANGYRFGFNGQEKVNEISGIGNHNTAQFWEYDTRLGRRWNLDPVDQVSISNYAVNRLNPIQFNDPNGDDPLKRAFKYAQKLGLKDNEYQIYDYKNNGAFLEYGGNGGVQGKIFKENLWDKIGNIFKKVDNTGIKYTYKAIAEWLPLTQGVTNLTSSATGYDFVPPSWDEAIKGSSIVPEKLSTQRRVTTGIVGLTQMLSLGIGGTSGFVVDGGLNLVGAGANNISNTETASPIIKLTANYLLMMVEGKKNPVGAVGEGLSIVNTIVGEEDKRSKDNK